MTTINTNVSETGKVDPVSQQLGQYFMVIVLFFCCGLVSLFGIVANIMNIIVLIKQGFNDSINISLMDPLRSGNIQEDQQKVHLRKVYSSIALTQADLLCVISMFWICFSCSPIFTNLGLPFNSYDVTYMTGTWIRLCSNRITSFINAFITLERCLCIASPLKVKAIITPLRTKMINVSIFIFMVVIFSPFYYVNKLEWRHDPAKNRTMLTLVFTEDKIFVETVTFPIHSVAMSAIALLTVCICTFILVVKLEKKSKWRQQSLAHQSSISDRSTIKEKKVVKMVTSISVIFIVCYTPSTLTFIAMTCEPELSITGQYMNMFYVVWSLTCLLETLSSSVNIFVYLKMSSKFRVTFLSIFSRSVKGDNKM